MTFSTNTELIYQYQQAKPRVETKWKENPLDIMKCKQRNKNYVQSNIQEWVRKRRNSRSPKLNSSSPHNTMLDSSSPKNLKFDS